MRLNDYLKRKIDEYKKAQDQDLVQRAYDLSMSAVSSLPKLTGGIDLSESAVKRLTESALSHPDFYIQVASIQRDQERGLPGALKDLGYALLELACVPLTLRRPSEQVQA